MFYKLKWKIKRKKNVETCVIINSTGQNIQLI